MLHVVRDGGRVSARHGLATVQALVSRWHHNSVYAVELDLILLVQRVEVQPDLAIIARLVHVEAIICVDGDCIGLT